MRGEKHSIPAPERVRPRHELSGAFRSRTLLLLAFSFAVMADPVSFIPIGALVVDFVLTIAISVSAGASAGIAYFPALAPWRLQLAL